MYVGGENTGGASVKSGDGKEERWWYLGSRVWDI